jgi:hypothetical protein
MRNVSYKSRRQTQNTHFIVNNIFYPENRAVCDIMWKNIAESERPIDDNMADARCAMDN